MPLTRSFKDLVKARADQDPAFRAALLAEAVETLLADDYATARLLIRDFINATIGFERLGEETGLGSKSLMRMFGASGNPTSRNLFMVIHALARSEGLAFEVTTTSAVRDEVAAE